MTESEHFVGSPAFKACALIIFGFVALNFIFPSTYLFPLDRKTVATFGATLCYVTRTFIFRGNFDIIGAIDFNVLVLLASIMVINHIVVHLPEVKKLIKVVQQAVLKSPVRGFWLISFVTFVVAPFLTNDGVCLLFVEIICEIFEEKELPSDFRPELQLERADAPYFLLTLACSSNIGSALTYTGNPQNMIVGQEAISVLSPARFIGYMMIPSLFSWGLTTWWIQRCWLQARKQGQLVTSSNPLCLNTASKETESNDRSRFGAFPQAVDLEQSALKAETEVATQTCQQQLLQLTCSENQSSSFALSPLSPRKQRQQQREAVVQKMVFMISSPIPYLIVMLLIFMIVMIFVNVMSISGLVCITAVVMVSTLVLGTLCRGQEVWAEVDPHTHQPLHPHTHAERIESITDFCDALFESIDYSLLMIFLGTFVVVANVDSTGLPNEIWNMIVGRVPFRSAMSIAGISAFILLTSQLLGNVAVVQLARPNVATLADAEKRLAWSIIAFVATVGGNLTLTGSAANIIVAEKAARIDPSCSIDFFFHNRVCFWVTLLCCTMGATLVTLIAGGEM